MKRLVENLLQTCDRFDSREMLGQRDFKVQKLQNFYFVTFGKIQIYLSYCKSEVVPYIDKPNEGIISFNCIIGSRRNDKVSNFLHKVYINQKVIDLESMCLEYGKKTIALHIDLRFLNQDGDIYEPSVLSVNYLLEELNIFINFKPVCYYFIAINDLLVRDPIEIEEQQKDWHYLIVMKSKGEFIYIEKAGQENELEDIYQVLETVMSLT